MPLTVIKAYRQCHSITLGNWWGGASAEEEMRLSREEMPFIIHLGEGTDDTTRLEFSKLKKRDLLRPNLLMIHGIALSAAELLQVASSRASLCWCPSSNFYLIGKTLDIETSLKLGINIVLGTDSTQTGGINILDEFATAHQHFPAIPLQSLYAMLTVNAAKALYLPDSTGVLNPDATSDLLLMDALDSNPFANLLSISSEHIRLLLHNGVPLYGDIAWMDSINCDTDNYTLFSIGKRKKFVLGNPLELNARIDAVLGYHKDFPYLPF
jgi:cytosine/adenosine deaminase-related metal-dependent hydrolase